VRCELETKPATPIVALRDDIFFISVRFSLPTYGYFAAGYGILHKLRWDAYTVDECSHRGAETPLYLPISAATVAGLIGYRAPSERLCIALVHGNRHARWVAMMGNSYRRVFLRGQGTCLSCFVNSVAGLGAKEDLLLIL
jgi:hypothetical protein